LNLTLNLLLKGWRHNAAEPIWTWCWTYLAGWSRVHWLWVIYCWVSAQSVGSS